MPRHEIHAMKIKDIKIALDHYLNPLQKEKYREWFLLKKADLVKLIFENNIQDEIVKLNKKLKLTPKYSVKQFPLKVLKKIIIKILTPDINEDFENWAVITKPQLIKLIIKHNLENKIFEKLTAKQAVKYNVSKKDLFKTLPIKESKKDIEEGEYKAEVIETKPKPEPKSEFNYKPVLEQIIKDLSETVYYYYKLTTSKSNKKLDADEKKEFGKKLDVLKLRVGELLKDALVSAGGEYNEDIVKQIVGEYTEKLKTKEHIIGLMLGTLKEESDEELEEKQRKRILEQIGIKIRKYYYVIYGQKKKKGLNTREKKEFNKDMTELKHDFDNRVYHAKDYFDDKGIEKLLIDFDQQIIENKELIDKMLSKDESKKFYKDYLYTDPKFEITNDQVIYNLVKLRDEYIESVKKHKLTKYPVGSPSPGGRAVNTIAKEWGELKNIALIRNLTYYKKLPTEEELRKEKESKKKTTGVKL